MKLNTVLETIDSERRRLLANETDPSFVEDVNSLAQEFEDQREPNEEFKNFPQLFGLCDFVDKQLSMEPDVAGRINKSRKSILQSLIDVLYDEQRNSLHAGELESEGAITRQRDVARQLTNVIPFVRQQNPQRFNSNWLKTNLKPDVFSKLWSALFDRKIGFPDWIYFKSMIPLDLQDKFDVSLRLKKDQEFINDIKDYIPIVKQLGPEAAAQFLVSTGRAGDRSFSHVVRIISEYLGRCAVQEPNFEDILNYRHSEELLRITDVRKLIVIYLRNYAYRRLIKDGYDELDPTLQSNRLHFLEEEIKELLLRKIDVATDSHQKLFAEIFTYFHDVLQIKSSARMVDHISDPKGHDFAFPSLRQKIAMHEFYRSFYLKEEVIDFDRRIQELESKFQLGSDNFQEISLQLESLRWQREAKAQEMHLSRRKIVEFFMARGKTATAFLAKEHLGCKKMLYVCPPHLVNQTAERIKKYYKPGQEPTVGIVSPGINLEALRIELQKEVIIFPYSMFSSRYGGEHLSDIIKPKLFKKKMIYFCQGSQADKTEQRLREVYKSDASLKVFKIYSGMSSDQLAASLTADIIVLPDDVATEQVGERTVIDQLQAEVGNNRFFICPPKLKKRLLEYKTIWQTEPSVGDINHSTHPENLPQVLDSEVITMKDDMLTQIFGGIRIVDEIKKMPFDFLMVDEVQNAKNDAGRNTRVVHELATEIPDLYENGYIMLASGDCMPDKPKDIVPQMRIIDNATYGNVRSLKSLINQVDPLKIRNSLMTGILNIDEPVDWQQYLVYEDYDLHQEEADIYNSILENENLEYSQKLDLLKLSLLNPNLFSLAGEIPSALFDETIEKIQECLFVPDDRGKYYDSMVIGENFYKHGFTREHEERTGASFVDKIISHYRQAGFVVNVFDGSETADAQYKNQISSDEKVIDFYLIDGNTPIEYREKAFFRAKKSDRKSLYFCLTSTMREGINLSYIHRALMLEPDYCMPNVAQFTMRFPREGNDDFKLFIKRAKATVHMGIYEHAMIKYALNYMVKHGGTFTENDLELLDSDDFDDNFVVRDQMLRMGTPIAEHIQSSADKLNKFFSHLHDRGSKYYRDFVKELGDVFAQLYVKRWKKSGSANNGRLVAGLITQMEKAGIIAGDQLADIACGPLVLENMLHGLNDSKKRHVSSVDLNGYMMDAGRKMLHERDPEAALTATTHEASMHDLKDIYQDNSLDVLNCAFALNYTSLNPRVQNPESSERVQTLLEFNRVLKTGGVMILTFPKRVGKQKEFDLFCQAMEQYFGFEVLLDYTGEGHSLDDDEDHHFQNYTIVCRKKGHPNLAGFKVDDLNLSRHKTKTQAKRRTPGPRSRRENVEPKGCLHTDFCLKSRTQLDLNYTAEDEIEEVIEQVDYTTRMTQAKSRLRRIFQENNYSFFKLDQTVLQDLRDKGIRLRALHSNGKVIYYFYIEGYADQPEFVYALDEDGAMIIEDAA